MSGAIRTYKVGEVAERYKVTAKRVYGWIDDRQLAALRLPGRNGHVSLRVRQEDLDEFERLWPDFRPPHRRTVVALPSASRKLIDHAAAKAAELPDSPAAFVYFIRQARGGPIKIGTAVDPAVRLKALQVGHHQKLVLLGAIAGNARTEREIHRVFQTSRISGEWFRASKRLLALIAEATKGRSNG